MEVKNSADNNKSKMPEDYIVGIGASAGGLEAMQKLLSALPSNTGFPYIIVQHLSPDYKSLMSEILGKYTDMPVVQVEDGMEVQPDCVYVIQPGKNMRISDGKLFLSPQREHELNLPIDLFFRSLADYAGTKAIAVILSGTGSDGSNGIKSIKENDGMIIVQEPENAKFDGMPRSAIRTGLVDAQITPEEIALELQHISTAAHKKKIPPLTEKQIDEELMKKVYFILKKISNINFTHYKQTTILRRIERRMMLVHKESLEEYVGFLYESPEEVKILSKEVLIGVTNFFRDPEYFQALKDKAIKNILLHGQPDEMVRVWVAGCSTGEEAYSIAILFCEMMETLKIKRNIKIFATDLDVEAISTAGKGIYGENIVDSVSASRLSRFFSKSGNAYIVNREIRQMIVFSPHNVFQDPPFGRLDLVSCRNMLIYFQTVLQNDLFAIFHTALKDGGFLFLGKSEAIGVYTEAYPVVDSAAKIFTHRADVRISGAKIVPYLQTALLDDDYIGNDDLNFKRQVSGEINAKDESAIDSGLLEKFMPACLVVNEKNEIIHTYGENSNYVHFSVGKVSNNLYDVITDALKIPVSTLLKEAREKHKAVQYKDICLNGEHSEVTVNITSMPASRKSSSGETYFAVIISEKTQKSEIAEAIPYEIDGIASQRITDLEAELGDVQEKLKHSVAEQECVNEELQAANEELLTANEELQSSNEELQSVNEELYTVNSEYQSKLSELADMNDDIANFLSSTMIGIIFVDNKLSIRRYTDYVATEFSVMDHDIGRSLKFISYHFPTVDISEICDNVLRTLVPDEREVTTGRNKSFFMRVTPYRSTENKILGCVITLVDITSQKQGLAMLKSTEQQLSLAQQSNMAKSEFLSKITHEIRTPIAALSELAETAQAMSNDDKNLKLTLNKLSETVGYINSIVTDISEMSKEDHLDESGEFDLKETVNSVKELIGARAALADLEFQTYFEGDFAPLYYGNESRIKQILVNFLSNAVKYTNPGGKITLKVHEDAIIGEQSSIGFTVSDTGIGITKEFLPEIFKPFTREGRGDNVNDRASMGLGLSIANNLIQMMGGDVKVESEVGKGTTFIIHVILNRVPWEVKDTNETPEPSSYGISGCRALVVDDNMLNRMILKTILAHEGIISTEACDGAEALRIYEESPDKTFDCILMDIRMPILDGIEASRRIRESGKPDAKTIPIIGVSANGFTDDIEKAKKVGINSYTTKPIDSKKLFGVLCECFRLIGKIK